MRLGMVGLNLKVIIETQSRSCLVAAIITFLIYTFLSNAHHLKRRAGLIALVGIAMLTVSIGVVFRGEIAGKVSEALFLEDRERGVGTGFTGRLDAWDEAYQMF